MVKKSIKPKKHKPEIIKTVEHVWILEAIHNIKTNVHSIEYLFRPFNTNVKLFISPNLEEINALINEPSWFLGANTGACTLTNLKEGNTNIYFHSPIKLTYLLHELVHGYASMLAITGLPNRLDSQTEELHAYSLSRFQASIIKKLSELNLLESIQDTLYG